MKIKLLSTCILIATSILCKGQNTIQVSTLAGSGRSGHTDAAGTTASFYHPSGVCSDAAGNIYVADGENNKIRKINPAGVVTTFAGGYYAGWQDATGIAASFWRPEGICSDAAGNIYVAEASNNRIRKITPAGEVTTLAGSHTLGDADATGIAASFRSPAGICSDAAGNIYVTDRGNNKIRKITPAGEVTTFAGSGLEGSTDATGIAASFKGPLGICSDAANNIYVADTYNHKIRKITPAGEVTTFAGSGQDGSIDAIGIAAGFHSPYGVCSDLAGNIFVADVNKHLIRKIQSVTPTPPVVNYLNLPASVCMGSTVDQSATTTGSAPQLVSSTVSLNILSPKAICKNDSFVFILNSVDDGIGNIYDTIRQYNFSGTLINSIGLLEIGNEIIAADTNNIIYAVHPDPNNSSVSNIRRILPNGFPDFAFSIQLGLLDKILALELGPDGYLYVSENLSGNIKKIDVSTLGVTNLPDPTPPFSFNKVVDFAFDKAGDMYLADIGANKILKRNATDNNYYPAVPGLDTLLPNITSISIDTSAGHFFLSSRVANTPITIMQANTPFEIIDSIYNQTTLNITKPKATMYVGNGSVPTFWALDSINNQVKIVSAGFYQITPALPSGLSYNIINGSIFGNALAPSPLTTYTISVFNSFGTTTSTVSFEVAPPTTLSNAPGTSSTIGNQADGLTIKYFSPNNCSKMIEIDDAPGGTAIGAVEVKETVSNLATFSSANFVGRVTEVNTQNPNAAAVLRLFFTHQDIVNYNAATAGVINDLTNDTLPTGLGTMQVAVLQLHTKENGHIEQIQHNPITANWNRTQQNWIVEFPITKFSTFYTGEPTALSTFTCENGSQSTIVSPNNFYIWNNGDSLLSSGQYMDTLVNRTGCDSILTLDLTLNAVGIDNTPVLEKGISLYPNPNSGLLHLDILNPNISITNVSITNLLGSEVYHADKVNSKSTLDLSTLQKGIYFVQISSDHEKITRKIILE